MVEVSIVLLTMSVIAGFALLDIVGIMPRVAADKAMTLTLEQLRIGRELAIAQRRSVEVKFLEDNEIQLVRLDMPTGSTILSTVWLENKVRFHLFDGVPDTPDSFGNAAAVDFGGSDRLIFLTDGTLVNVLGNPLNGSVFLGLPDRPETARAVTLLGATGRVRGYRWTGTSWIQ
jgi:hypothetical protein